MVGLTDTGLEIETLDSLLDSVGTSQKANINADLNTNADSALGNINSIVCAKIHEAWEHLELAYQSAYPDTASGVPLAYVSGITGTTRRAATKSTVLGKVELSNGFDLASGSTAYVGIDPSMKYTTTEAVPTNTTGSAAWFEVEMEALETGSRPNANTGTLDTIDTPVAGWLSVGNDYDSEPGLDLESDTDLRTRREAQLATPGTGTTPAIIADISDLDGVTGVHVFENQTGLTNPYGVPPYAIEILVSGSGVVPQDVFDQIHLSKPSGKRTYGTETGFATDAAGFAQPVAYTEPTEVRAYVSVVLTTIPDLYVGDEAVASAIAAWEDSLALGESVYASDIVNVVADLGGVESVDVTQVEVDRVTPPVTVNLTATAREFVSIDSADVTVVSS